MPQVAFDSDFIVERCQPTAKPGNHAVGCYLPNAQKIVLRSRWDGSGNDNDVLKYEMLRHVTQACLGKPFNLLNESYTVVLHDYEVSQ
jgi:hypothetical protein